MKARLSSIVLSLSLLCSTLVSQGAVYADNPEIQSGEAQVVDPAQETTAYVQNPVLSDLIRQAKDEYQDEDEISLIVEVNDKVMREVHSMDVPDIALVKTSEGLEAQIQYASESQDKLRDIMDDKQISYVITERYETVLNGFSLKTSFAEAKEIAVLPEVASVQINRVIPAPVLKEVDVLRPKDTSSNEMIHAQSAWDSKYTGKRQLIAVIDSGADPNHEIFQKVDETSLRIRSMEETNQLISEKQLSAGKYYNAKIPFGFNYAERNTEIKERTQSSHGMHVAGIIAANGENLKGVAPDAQLAVMRVFGGGLFGGGTTPEIYNKAIDDAVKMGVDSINMSLGSTSATDSGMEPTTVKALQDAQKAGIVVAIAAGNDGFMGFGPLDKVPSTQPDYGTINSPSVTDISLSVASVENTKVKQKGMLLHTDPAKNVLYSATDKKPFPSGKLRFVEVGKGYKEDYTGKSVRDKVALIERGEDPEKGDFTFYDKVKIAQENGAVAAIVYNHLDEDQLTRMAGLDKEEITIPSCFISKKSGELLKNHSEKEIEFSNEESFIANPNGYKLSAFSSWGMTQEGNLKPDISAPGGNIYSSINNGAYEVLSGTSMATPHVAGGIAVVKQYVEAKFPTVVGEEKHALVKNLLMSTASPYKDANTQAYGSPRGQGAGLMNLQRALRSSVVAIGTNGVSSVNLRNIEGNTVEVRGKLKNYGSSRREFEYYAVLNTDTVEDGKALLKPYQLQTTAESKKSITVEPNAEVEFSVSFTLSESEISRLMGEMPKGFFLEGYVFFTATDGGEDVNLPYVGFRGNWENLDVIEPSIYDLLDQNRKPYYYELADRVEYPFTYLSSKEGNKLVALGELADSTFADPKYEKDKIAFSPNGDGSGDYAAFFATFLRNYKDFQLNVYYASDVQNSNPIYSVSQKDDKGRKNYFISGFGGPNLNTNQRHWKWEGKNASDELVQDGHYRIVVEAKPDGKFNNKQTLVFPVTVDTVFPRIVKSSYEKSTGIYHLEQVEEKGSGIRKQVIKARYNDEDKVYLPDSDGRFTLPTDLDSSNATLVISDYAYNTLELPLDKSVRKGTERSIIVNAKISSGSVSKDKFKWIVLDSNGAEADPYNLEVGNYTLVISDVDEMYELVGSDRIPFEIRANDPDYVKVIDVNFSYKDRSEVFVSVAKPREASLKLFMVDRQNGAEYELTPKVGLGIYTANIPNGEYKLTVRDLDENYYAMIPIDTVTVEKGGTGSVLLSVEVNEKRMKEVTVTLVRNGYQGPVDMIFRGKDHIKSRYELSFGEGEVEKKVMLPNKLEFNIYMPNLEGTGYGSPVLTYKPVLRKYNLTVELIKDATVVPVPVDKDALILKINQARQLKEENFDLEEWEVFEVVLEEAEKVLADPSATQDQIDSAREKLSDAMNQLISSSRESDKKRLEEKIREAEDIYASLDENYTQDSKEFLVIAIEGAKMTLRSKEPEHNTPEHIQATIDMLDRAIKNLKRIDGKVDKSELGILLKEADELIANEASFTEESIGALKDVYQNAKDVFEDEDASDQDVKDIIGIFKGYLALVESKANKDELRNLVDEISGLDLKQYKIEGRRELRKALREAKRILDDKRVTQEEVDAALQALVEKKNALEKKDGEGDVNESFAIVITTTSGITVETIPADKAKQGEEVQIIVSIEEPEKYELGSLKVVDDQDNEVPVTDYKFVMPGGDVEILATLKEKVKPTPSPGGSPGGSSGGGGGGGGSSSAVTAPKQVANVISRVPEKIKSKIDQIQKNTKIYSSQTLKALEEAMKLLAKDEKAGQKALDKVLEDARVEKITYTLEQGYMQGYEGNKFKPDAHITRAEASILFADLIEEEELKKLVFSDVKQDVWYTAAVMKLSSTGYLRAREDGNMHPNDEITRAEYAYILAKLRNLPPANKIMRDVPKEHWAAEAIAASIEAGIISGYDDGTVRPDQPITRAEAVSMIQRTFNTKKDIKEKTPYSDVPEGHWAYDVIVAARK
ncbi:MAG: S8 family serine peptidase [Filifactor alocis]|nr:S8 family serine peptidase [Filifactor alocis]